MYIQYQKDCKQRLLIADRMYLEQLVLLSWCSIILVRWDFLVQGAYRVESTLHIAGYSYLPLSFLSN